MAESLGQSVLDLRTDDSKLEEGLRNAKGTVKAAAAAIGAAAGAALTAGAVKSIEKEALSDKLAAQINLPPEQAQRAGQIAGSLFSQGYGSSLEEVNEALASIHTNIGELSSFSNAEIEGMAQSALDLAKAFDVDVNRAARGAGQMIRNGLAKDATEAFDLITVGMQGLDASLRDELIDTLEEYSADFQQLGLTGPQVMGMISNAVKNGARNTDLAADAIREFSIRAIDGSTLTSEAFEDLGFDAEKMANKIAQGGPKGQRAMSQVVQALGNVGNKVKQEQIGVALFGTRFEEMGMTGIAALDPLASEMDNVNGAAERMGETLNDNAQTKITAFQRSIMGMLTNLVETPGVVGDAAAAVAGMGMVLEPVAPMMTGITVLLKEQITQVVSFVGKGAGQIIAATGKMAGRTVAATAKIIARWALMGAKSLIHAAKVAASWLIAMGPIAIVIAIIIALVVLIVKNWDKIKRVIRAGWEAVKRFTKSAWNAIKNAVGSAASWVVSKVRSAWDSAKNAVRSAGSALVSTVRNAWSRIKSAVRNGIQAVLGFIRSLPGRIKSALGNLGGLLLNAGKAVIQGFLNGIRSAFDRVRSTLSSLTSLLPSWKGPETTDRRILMPAGHAVIEGFVTGIDDEIPSVAALLQRFTGDLSAHVAMPSTRRGAVGAREPVRVELDFLGQGDLVELIRRAVRRHGGGGNAAVVLSP